MMSVLDFWAASNVVHSSFEEPGWWVSAGSSGRVGGHLQAAREADSGEDGVGVWQ